MLKYVIYCMCFQYTSQKIPPIPSSFSKNVRLTQHFFCFGLTWKGALRRGDETMASLGTAPPENQEAKHRNARA